MRTTLGFSLGLLLFTFATPSPALTPLHFWSQSFGSTASDIGDAVAMDGSGNVVVIGQFGGTVDFGGGDLVSAGGSDIFVARYDVSGAHQWSESFGGTGNDVGQAVAMDASGNVVVAGLFNGTVDFGGGALTSAGSNDIFVAKYDASGGHLWSKRFGSTGSDIGYAVATDASGNVVVTGQFNGTVDFGGGALVSAGGTEIFVAKYNSSGVHQWSKRFGSTTVDIGYAVATDASGNVVVTGQFAGTVDFGGGNRVSAGVDIFVAKYNASGVHQWSQRFGGSSSDIGNAVAVDGSGNVVVTGQFTGTADFGGGALVGQGGWEAFVAKYNASGVHQWSQRYGNANNDFGNAVTVDGSGSVAVTGGFSDDVDFGGGTLKSAGNDDIFVAKYDASGAHQWSQRFGSTSSDQGYAVAVDGSSNVAVTGYFEGNVNFGGGTYLSGALLEEMFLAKYGDNAPEPLISSISDIGNDQGRKVRIQFSRSGHDDVAASTPVTQYEAYRRNDGLPSAPEALPPGVRSHEQLLADGWVQAATISAYTENVYLIDAPTDADSTESLGQHYSVFFIRAATAAPGTFFDSPIDSGYSLDNLAPGVPASFAYNAGQLSWNESSAADFDFFSVYGSNTSSFGAATLVDYTTGTNLNVSSAGYAFYFVTATDFSGNEGNAAVINTLTGVGGTPKNYVLSISSYPNPFNPATTVRYTLPSRGRVTIAVYDLRGAHVARLVDQEMDAGAHTVGWNGRDDRGNPAGSGVYFARLSSAAGSRSYKMTLLK